jgi:hypothetical protein
MLEFGQRIGVHLLGNQSMVFVFFAECSKIHDGVTLGKLSVNAVDG